MLMWNLWLNLYITLFLLIKMMRTTHRPRIKNTYYLVKKSSLHVIDSVIYFTPKWNKFHIWLAFFWVGIWVITSDQLYSMQVGPCTMQSALHPLWYHSKALIAHFQHVEISRSVNEFRQPLECVRLMVIKTSLFIYLFCFSF